MEHSIINFVGGFAVQLFVVFNCFILSGCITKYEASGIDEAGDILVVEGVITDDETVITLSRSMNLTGEENHLYYVDNAEVYVECDDGMRFHAEPHDWGLSRNGQYTIKTEQLNLACKYCLKINIDKHEYVSDFSYPIETPEIDSVFWSKRALREPIMIYVATHPQENELMYFRWTYNEDWEYHSFVDLSNDGYPHRCWSSANSRDILLSSAENTIFGQFAETIIEMPPSDRKLSVLYRITVTQNAISKRAHDYFANIKKNAEQMGSIFAPTPSELRGNIVCITDPSMPVIGYIDVSTATQKAQLYISGKNVYEKPYRECMVIYNNPPPSYIVQGYHRICVDCTWDGDGIPRKPNKWPDYRDF